MSTNAAAQLLSTMLYGRRFFPYYTINIIAGLDEEGVLLCLGLGGEVRCMCALVS